MYIEKCNTFGAYLRWCHLMIFIHWQSILCFICNCLFSIFTCAGSLRNSKSMTLQGQEALQLKRFNIAFYFIIFALFSYLIVFLRLLKIVSFIAMHSYLISYGCLSFCACESLLIGKTEITRIYCHAFSNWRKRGLTNANQLNFVSMQVMPWYALMGKQMHWWIL